MTFLSNLKLLASIYDVFVKFVTAREHLWLFCQIWNCSRAFMSFFFKWETAREHLWLFCQIWNCSRAFMTFLPNLKLLASIYDFLFQMRNCSRAFMTFFFKFETAREHLWLFCQIWKNASEHYFGEPFCYPPCKNHIQ